MQFIKLLIFLFGLLFVTTTVNAQTTATTNEGAATEVMATAKTIKVKAKVDGVSVCETLKKGATTTFSVTFNPTVADEKAIYTAVEDTPGCSNQTARPYKVKM